MKKRLLFLSFALISSTIVLKAQSLNFSNFISTVQDASNQNMLESFLTIQNSGGSSIDVICERTILAKPANMTELFCFGQYCNPPGTDITTYVTPIANGATNTTFKADVIPNGECGVTSINYKFSDQNNAADSTSITLNFEFCAVGISENNAVFGLSRPLRNPADQFTIFSYNLKNEDLNDRLLVYNMLGSLVKTMDIAGKNGTLVLNTSDLQAGVYFASYISAGKIKNSYKLVVSHR